MCVEICPTCSGSHACDVPSPHDRMEIRGRKVIVQMLTSEDEESGAGARHFMTMDDEGGIQTHRNARQVVRWVKQRDELAAKRGESTATIIEWRDMPEGFEPPEVS